MKKIWKRAAAAGLAVAIALSLAACGSKKDDMSVYVKGLMDECYRGEYDPEFLEFMEITKSEADETYLGNLTVDANNFAYYYDIITNYEDEYDEDLQDEIISMYQDLYNKVAYTVKPSVKTDSGYSVEIAVTPNNVYKLVDEGWDDFIVKFHEDYLATSGLDIVNMSQEEMSAMSDEDYAAYDRAYAEAIIQYFRDTMAIAEPMEEETLVVQVKQDSEGYWDIPEKDWNKIDTYFNFNYGAEE